MKQEIQTMLDGLDYDLKELQMLVTRIKSKMVDIEKILLEEEEVDEF